jgi:hypothetical protein
MRGEQLLARHLNGGSVVESDRSAIHIVILAASGSIDRWILFGATKKEAFQWVSSEVKRLGLTSFELHWLRALGGAYGLVFGQVRERGD